MNLIDPSNSREPRQRYRCYHSHEQQLTENTREKKQVQQSLGNEFQKPHAMNIDFVWHSARVQRRSTSDRGTRNEEQTLWLTSLRKILDFQQFLHFVFKHDKRNNPELFRRIDKCLSLMFLLMEKLSTRSLAGLCAPLIVCFSLSVSALCACVLCCFSFCVISSLLSEWDPVLPLLSNGALFSFSRENERFFRVSFMVVLLALSFLVLSHSFLAWSFCLFSIACVLPPLSLSEIPRLAVICRHCIAMIWITLISLFPSFSFCGSVTLILKKYTNEKREHKPRPCVRDFIRISARLLSSNLRNRSLSSAGLETKGSASKRGRSHIQRNRRW